MRNAFFRILAVVVLILAAAAPALACPAKNDILDYNCDGKVQIFFVGDSLVFGTGDSANGNKGGYVARLKKSLKKVSVKSYGIKGLRALTLVRLINETYLTKDDSLYPQFRKNLAASDLIVIDVGRNDRWLRDPALKTYRQLSLIATGIAKGVKQDTGFEPLVVKAVLMLPNRGDQGPWVKELNQIILRKTTTRFPSNLRFDTVSKRLLNADQLHPTPKGYAEIAKVFKAYIPTVNKYFNLLRPDTDLDGISDVMETKKFFTDPTKTDTDGDMKSDTAEIFTLGTNPLVID